jgi:cytochrome b
MSDRITVLVWDLPVRIFHWLLAISFLGAWLSAEIEGYEMLHYAFGYTAGLLVVFRIVWGVIGSQYARFSDFIKGPKAIYQHIDNMMKAKFDEAYLGHNPLGAVVMVGLMLLTLATVATGYLMLSEILGESSEALHEGIASVMMAVVVIHILAAVVMSFLQKENLPRAMVTGKKLTLNQRLAIKSSHLIVGLLLLAIAGYFFWSVLNGAWPQLTHAS